MSKILTVQQVRYLLQDRRLEVVANSIGLSYHTLQRIRDNDEWNVSYNTLKKLSDYFNESSSSKIKKIPKDTQQ